MVQCVSCSAFSLRDSALVKVGYGRCKYANSWEFKSPRYERNCAKYSAEVDNNKIALRVAWLDGNKI